LSSFFAVNRSSGEDIRKHASDKWLAGLLGKQVAIFGPMTSATIISCERNNWLAGFGDREYFFNQAPCDSYAKAHSAAWVSESEPGIPWSTVRLVVDGDFWANALEFGVVIYEHGENRWVKIDRGIEAILAPRIRSHEIAARFVNGERDA
jgi:hypothetical protein